MIDDEASLEGWAPEPGPTLPLTRIVELAFDYRGNTTVVRTDGSELEGYVFNRNAEAPEPFLQMFDGSGNGPIRIPYRDIRSIRFTGKDPAAGNSYTAWLRRREQERGGGTALPPPPTDDGPPARR
jgi:hypothetical protein